MTLELTTAAHRRPAPRPRPGTALTVHQPGQPPVAVSASRRSAVTGLDRFARGAYRSAAAGLLVAAAAFAIATLGHFPFATRTGYLLYTTVLIGAIMVVGGGIAGSARPTTGGNR